ncbi:MAG: acyltransferase family protein [Phycisphaerales bacterium]
MNDLTEPIAQATTRPSGRDLVTGVSSRRLVHGAYFPHIDGIRALAVLPVLLFHVFPWLCPGGFCGVDVFFVISGYLITGSILRDLQNNHFTIRGFYHRRIRRIFPANFALIAGVFVAGCAIYYCVPLKRLGDTMVASTLFSANLFFWSNVGNYFEPEVHGNPLLNLWSLSVEEQFYLFIPLLCAIVFKFQRCLVAPALAIVGILSFCSAVYAVTSGNQSSAFYLLHYRAWELAAGCMLATIVDSRHQTQRSEQRVSDVPPHRTRNKVNVLATAGMVMVMAPYWALSSRTPFPGAAALPSVLGTALLICFGQASFVGRVLTWRPMVFVGLISYSLYLWHWPVTVFWKYAVYDQLYAWDYAGMLVLSFLLAFLSWRFVEVPVRTSPTWTKKKSFAFAGTGVALLVSVGAACSFSRGWPTILHPRANRLTAEINIQTPSSLENGLLRVIRRAKSLLGQDSSNEEVTRWRLLAGLPGRYNLGLPTQPEVALIGDSHAGALGAGLDVWLLENDKSGLLLSQSATPMFDLSLPQCREALSELDKYPTVTKVILAQGWFYLLANKADSGSNLRKIEEFADEIRRRRRTLYVTSDVPLFNGTDIAAKSAIIAPREMEVGWDGTLTQQQHDEAQGQFNSRLKDVCHRTGAVFVPLHLAFMQSGRYVAFEEQNGKRIALYRNYDHVSVEGAIRAIRFLMPHVFVMSTSIAFAPDSPSEQR